MINYCDVIPPKGKYNLNMAYNTPNKGITPIIKSEVNSIMGEGYFENVLNDAGSVEDVLAIFTHKLSDLPNIKEKSGIGLHDAIQTFILAAYRELVPSKMKGVTNESALELDLFRDIMEVPFPAPKKPKFTFIDLFAGIGGFRIAMQQLGGKCVYSSEFDYQAQKTYFANYGEMPFGDITKESNKSFIPDGFDVLCGGFPCQAFSLAGKRLGFEDETRGTLFFEIEEILRRKQPKAFFLENVKGLMIHKGGKTIKTILEHLDDAGYDVVPPETVNAMDFGVPQHRERVYIIGFRKDLHIDINKFKYPKPLTPEGCRARFIDIREKNPVPAKYYLSTRYVDTLVAHKARHEAKGNGFGYEIIKDDEVANAIVVGGMGRERNLVIDFRQKDLTPTTNIKGGVNTDGIRRMTPREWARLQGFPEEFKIVVADASAYKQFGNSVAIPAIKATAENELLLLNLI